MENNKKPEGIFEETLAFACHEMLDQWAEKKAEESAEYKAYAQEAAKKEEALRALLGENSSLLAEYTSDLAASLHCRTVPTYLQGFRDCYLLLRKLELL